MRGSMLSLLGSVASTLASGRVSDTVNRVKTAAIIYSIAGVLSLVGLVFLLVAGWFAVAHRIGPVMASLAFAGLFIGLAIIALLVHMAMNSAREKKIRERRKDEAATVAAAASVAGIGLAAAPLLSNPRAASDLSKAALLSYVVYRIYKENR